MTTKENETSNDTVSLPEPYDRRTLNAMYRAIPMRDSTSLLLRKYFCAIANLYGILSVRDAFDLLRRYHPRLFTKEAFLAFSQIARHEVADYYILGHDELYCGAPASDPMDREIIHIGLFLDEDVSYYDIVAQQIGKPLYIPDRKESLLNYADWYYAEPTPELNALTFFLSARLPKEIRRDLYRQRMAIADLISYLPMDAPIQKLIVLMDEAGVRLKGERDMEKFVRLYMACHNTTRLFVNRGHTPYELVKLLPPRADAPPTLTFTDRAEQLLRSGAVDFDDMRAQIQDTDFPDERLREQHLAHVDRIESEVKKAHAFRGVGRNDPCPCGSGKKFKKCCGR